jgi:hypothetical protein
VFILTTHPFGSSDVFVFPTSLPPHLTNLPHALSPAPSSVIQLSTRDIDATTVPRAASFSRNVSFDEHTFPFNEHTTQPRTTSDDIDDSISLSPLRPLLAPAAAATNAPHVPATAVDSPLTSAASAPSATDQPLSPPNIGHGSPTCTSPTPTPIQPKPKSLAPTHNMITRAQKGIFRPNPKYTHLATDTTVSPIPKTVRTALRDPLWLTAMQEEYRALMANNTWTLVPRPPGACHRQVAIPAQVQGRRHPGTLQGTLGCPRLLPTPRCGL